MAKTPNQTPAAPALSMARAQLQQAREAKARAIALADKAQAVVDAANAALEEARAESARYDEAHEDSVKLRLDALKGNPAAKNPEQLREARRARLVAREEVLEADQVLAIANTELQDAQGNIGRGNKVCNSHITSCLSEAVSDVILEWEKVNLERERLRAILRAFIVAEVNLDAMTPQQQSNILGAGVAQAGLPFGDAVDWKHLQNKVGAALSHNFAQRDPGPSIARSRQYWASFADALLADPSAEQPPLPGGDALFG